MIYKSRQCKCGKPARVTIDERRDPRTLWGIFDLIFKTKTDYCPECYNKQYQSAERSDL